MAQSLSTYDRSKYHQESPLFWLYLIGASLAMHLAIVLIGRWYLTQTSSSPTAGSSSGSVQFVEIDPNTSVSRNLKSVAPSTTAIRNEPSLQAAPPTADNSSEAQSSSNTSILENSTRGLSPDPRPSKSPLASSSPFSSPSPSFRPSPSPLSSQPKSNQGIPSQNRQQPVKQSGTTGQPSSSAPPSESSSTSPQTGASQASGSGTSSEPSPSDSSSQPPGNANSGSLDSSPNDSKENSNGTPNSSSSSDGPSRSGTSLNGYSSLGAQITSKLEIPAFARNQTSAKTARLISPVSINLAYPLKLPTQVLDLRISLVIDNDSGSVLGLKVLDDSPTLKAYPGIDKGLVEGAVAQAFYAQAKFQVDVETNQGEKAPASDWETSIRVQLSP